MQSCSSFSTAFASFCRQRLSYQPTQVIHLSYPLISYLHQRHPAQLIQLFFRLFLSFVFPFHLFASLSFSICPVSPILVAHDQPVQNIARRSAVAAIAPKSKLYVHCVDAYVIQYVARNKRNAKARKKCVVVKATETETGRGLPCEYKLRFTLPFSLTFQRLCFQTSPRTCPASTWTLFRPSIAMIC